MKILGTNIDRHAAVALGLLALIWLGFLGFDIHLVTQWLSGNPKHAKDWQGVLFISGGVVILPVYMSVLLWPKSRLANWLNNRTKISA